MFWSSSGCVGLLRCCSVTVSLRPLITHISRTFSTSASAKGQTHEGSNRPVKQWDLAVSPFSTVRAQLGCGISVSPLDPHAFPEADRAFITVCGTDAELEGGLHHVQVRYDEHSKELLISAVEVNSDVSMDVTAPIKSSECLLMIGKASSVVIKLYLGGSPHQSVIVIE